MTLSLTHACCRESKKIDRAETFQTRLYAPIALDIAELLCTCPPRARGNNFNAVEHWGKSQSLGLETQALRPTTGDKDGNHWSEKHGD